MNHKTIYQFGRYFLLGATLAALSLTQPARAETNTSAALPALYTAEGMVWLRDSISAGDATTTFTYSPHPPQAAAFMGDWDGDGIKTIGVYGKDGVWRLRNQNSEGAPDAVAVFGNPAKEIPVVGHWFGPGADGIGVFNPETAKWTLSRSANKPSADLTVVFGKPGDKPVVGDWDGDGTTTIGVVRDDGYGTMVWILSNSNSKPAEHVTVALGNIRPHQPLVGDWDGDGADNIGVYERTSSIWVLTRSLTEPNDTIVHQFTFGRGGAGQTALMWNRPASKKSTP